MAKICRACNRSTTLVQTRRSSNIQAINQQNPQVTFICAQNTKEATNNLHTALKDVITQIQRQSKF